MGSRESVEEWARTAEFPDPIVWGDVEAGILTRKPKKGPRTPVVWLLGGALGWFVLVFFGVLFCGAAVLGLGFVVLGRTGDGVGWDWGMAARVAFVVAILVQVSSFSGWLETRRRSIMSTAASAVTLVASLVAYVVLRIGGGAGLSWLSVFVAVAAVSALIVLVLGLLSKPEGRPKSRKPPRRGPRRSSTWRDYKDARAQVLAILEKRGLVTLDEADRKRLNEMPLGYWEELDGVDEKEWRRILEYRHVGWRDFDRTDRRPWPPTDGG